MDRYVQMNVLVEYFGFFIFAFVVLVGGLVALPELTAAPVTSIQEILGLGLAFVVIAGGFSWYYFATSPESVRNEAPPSENRRRR